MLCHSQGLIGHHLWGVCVYRHLSSPFVAEGNKSVCPAGAEKQPRRVSMRLRASLTSTQPATGKYTHFLIHTFSLSLSLSLQFSVYLSCAFSPSRSSILTWPLDKGHHSVWCVCGRRDSFFTTILEPVTGSLLHHNDACTRREPASPHHSSRLATQPPHLFFHPIPVRRRRRCPFKTPPMIFCHVLRKEEGECLESFTAVMHCPIHSHNHPIPTLVQIHPIPTLVPDQSRQQVRRFDIDEQSSHVFLFFLWECS